MNRRFRPSSAVVALLSGGLLLAGATNGYGGQIQFDPPVPARNAAPAIATGSNTIAGRVVDGTTGVVVSRARVRIVGRGGTRPSVVTDRDGAFAFAQMPGGSYSILVDKRGYQPSTYPERGRGLRPSFTPLTVQDGQAVNPITVPLYRGGVIVGRVTDAHGEPIEWVQVRALKAPRRGRVAVRETSGGGATTNDIGEFRLAGLATGSYIVVANPMRLFGPERVGPDAMLEVQPQPAPMYYPDAVTIEQAQAVPVQRGQVVSGIDISLSEVFMGTLSGTVIDATGQPVTANGRISISSLPHEGFGGGGTGTELRPDGTFRAVMPAGEYLVEGSVVASSAARSGRTDPVLVGSEFVTLTSGGSETVLITVGKAATGSGRILFEGTSPLPSNPGHFDVNLVPVRGSGCFGGSATIAPDWSFKVEGLTGTCSGQPFGFGRWMLKSVLYEGEDLLDRTLTFKPGQEYRDLQVVFTDRRTEITFRVNGAGGQATREYVAVVFPAAESAWRANPYNPPARWFVPAQSSSTALNPLPAPAAISGAPELPRPRREVMEGLRPGEYLAIALDNVEFDDLRDPDVLGKLAAQATRVLLADGARLELSLHRYTFADVIR